MRRGVVDELREAVRYLLMTRRFHVVIEPVVIFLKGEDVVIVDEGELEVFRPVIQYTGLLQSFAKRAEKKGIVRSIVVDG